MLEQKLGVSTLASDDRVVPRGIGDAGSWIERAASADEWERQHEAEWVRIDQKLRGIAARRAALDAEEARLLRYAETLKLWRGWGFGNMVEYLERAMGYAPHTANERLRVARALAELPLIEEALERGELSHSAVRELSRVAVPETEAAWLEAAQGKCLRQIEAAVSGHRPGDLPDDPTEPRLHRRTITLELSPESYDLWRKLHALATEEHGQHLSDDELIPALFRRAYGGGLAVDCTGTSASAVPDSDAGAGIAERGSNAEERAGGDAACGDAGAGIAVAGAVVAGTAVIGAAGGSVGVANAASAAGGAGLGGVGSTRAFGAAGSPAYKIALKQCPDCRQAWQFTGGRDIEVEPAVLELAACDAVHLGSLDATVPERATMTVTPRKREQVLARDGHCCSVPGCRRNIGLDLHHIEYQSRGGGHALSNLTTLCDLHHRAVHFERLAIRGTAPDQLAFEFRKPRDRRNVTDDDPLPREGVISVGSSMEDAGADSLPSAGRAKRPTWAPGAA